MSIVVIAAAGCGDSFTTEGDGGAGADAGTGGTAGAGGGTGGEICHNGVDDDGDQLVDCSDSDCQAQYACVPPPPSGWTAVGWLEPSTQTSCPSGMVSRDLFEEAALVLPSPQCQCSCGAVQGAACVSSVVCANNAECDTSDSPTAVGTSCTLLNLPGSVSDEVYCEPSLPYPQAGSCAPSLAPLPAIDWLPSHRSCLRNEVGSCSDGQACVRRPPSGATGPCVARDGDQACPAPYTDRYPFRPGTYEDNRACSACCCGTPQGVGCGTTGTVAFWSQAGCSGSQDQTLQLGVCAMVSSWTNTSSAELHTPVATGGYCDSCGGDPTGGVSPTGWITICCLPE